MIDSKQEETWKTYPDYPFIEANQFGEIRTKDRWVTCKNGVKRLYKGRVLKQQISNSGYMYVVLSMSDKVVNLSVHRIVATCFIPNPDNLPEVNHIDDDRTNNSVDNLEWCTRRYNQTYREKYGIALSRPVIAVNLDTLEVFWFKSQHEAGRKLGVYSSNINMVINGKLNKTHGWWFINSNNTAVEKVREKFGDDIANEVEKLINKSL